MSETAVNPTPEPAQATQPPVSEPAQQPEASAQTDAGQRDTDQPLKEPGLKALQAERDRADRLEAEIKALRPQTEQQQKLFDQLRGVFGDQAADVKPEDVVKNLQQEMAQLRHERAVDQVARQFGITEEADLNLLRSAQSPELMQQWGERLKPAPKSPAAPEPDPGQGARTGTQSEEDVEYQKFYPSTRK